MDFATALAAMVESSSDAVIAKSVDGRIRRWNRGAAELYGTGSNAMVGTSVDGLIPEADRHAERRLREYVGSGKSVRGHYCTRRRADGTLIDVVVSMSPVRDASGSVSVIVSLSRLVRPGERQAARFASLLEAAPDAIIGVNEDGAIAIANARAETMFGYPPGHLAGIQLSDLLPDEIRAIHASHVVAFRAHPQSRAMGSGLELKARRRDGSVFPVEISLAPEKPGADGYVIAAVRDVTERAGMESLARESADRLRQLAESTDIMFILLDLDAGEVLYISAAANAIFGRAPQEFLDAADPIALVVHPDDRDWVASTFLESVNAGRPVSSEHRVLRADGQERWVRAVSRPVAVVDGGVHRTVLTVEDITDRVAAQEALEAAESMARQASEAKNQFLSRMSHELRTPLNAVLGFGQLLQYELADTPHHDAVKQIVNGGRHLLNLIDDVLDFARIEAGEMSISREPVELPGLIGETVDLMSPLAAAGDVTIVGDVPDGEWIVLADRQRLRQVLLNLLSNAVKYNRRGGRVWVEVSQADDAVSLTVWDDGPGIPADLRARLFTPFDRLGADLGGIDGTGIGLALTRSLVELMGGALDISPVSVSGVGFTVTLLRASDATSTDPARAPTSAGAVDHRQDLSLTLLYIEDNEPNVRVVESILGLRPHWTAMHAGLGGLGIDLARAHQPDLVLLDLHLPDRAGADVLLALKSDPQTTDIPVVVITADASQALPHRMRSLGAAGLLTKPFDLAEFLAILDSIAGPGA